MNSLRKTTPALVVSLCITAPTLAQSNSINSPEELEEIVVRGHIILGERRAIELQRQADSILNVISADGIGKLPDRNAAEAVQRVPGVSIVRDQGEGRFVAVRGMPTQWNSTTLNGSRLPTAEEETTSRSTAFDFFPSELIKRVEVSKALTPDMEGDAIGGSVNFVTATAPEDYILSTTLAANYNDKTAKSGYNANFVYGDKGDKFGFLINGTVWERDWATDNFEPRRGSDGFGIRRLELRDYTGVRTTKGLNAAAEYNINDDNKVFVRAQYGNLADHEIHYKHRYRFDKDRVELQNIFNELITEFSAFEIGGNHYFDSSSLEWGISTADNQFYYGCIPNCEDKSYFLVRFDQKGVGYTGLGADPAAFVGSGLPSSSFSYNTIDGGASSASAPSTHLPSGFRHIPSQQRLANVELYKVDVNEKDRIVFNIDYEITLNSGAELKFGTKYRDKVRNAVFADEFYSWDESKGPVPTLADFSLSPQPGTSGYDIGTANTYSADFSGVVSEADILNWYNSNRQNLVLDEADSALVSNGGALGRNFKVEEQQTALYGMASWDWSEKWSMVAGVRLEQTKSKVIGQVYLEESNEVVDSIGEKDYVSVLPSIHAKYRMSEDSEVRFAVGRSFARPDFGDLNSGGAYSEHDNELFTGNPELNPTYSNNVDLIYSKYLGDSGVFSAGLFYKHIQDPVFESSTIGSFNGRPDVTILRPDNGDNARLWGAEFTYSKQFDNLPGAWKNFGVNTNLTLMGSEFEIDGRRGNVALPGQADYLYNISAYYDDSVFSARLALNHKDKFIEEYSSSTPDLDFYYGEYTSVDLSMTYSPSDNMTWFVELNNLTNEPLSYFYGSPERPAQVEYYGIRGQLGMKFEF